MNRVGRLLAAVAGAGSMGHSILRVGGATVFAQAIGLAAIPVLSRVFDEAAFGMFGLFFNLVTVTGVVSTLGLHEAVLAPHRRTDSLALLGAGMVINTLMSFLVAVLAFGLIRSDVFGLGVLPLWSAALVLPTQWLIGMTMMLQIWAVRKRAVNSLALASMAQGVGRAGAQVGLGLTLGAGWLGLLAGEVVGRGLAVATMASRCWPDLRLAARLSPRRMMQAVVRFRDFPLWRTPSHLANNLASTMPLFLMASVFPAPTIGQFAFMMMIVVAPIGLVLRAVGDVFLGEFGLRFRRDPQSARMLLYRTAALLALPSIPAGILLMAIGAPAFGLVFGENWREAGLMASVYAPVLVANLVVAPLGGVLSVVRRPSYKLYVDLAGIALQAAGFAWAQMTGADAIITAAAIFAGYFTAYLIYLALIFFAASNPGQASPGGAVGARGARL